MDITIFPTGFADAGMAALRHERMPQERARLRELERAWKGQYCTRFCPPADILCACSQPPELVRHLSVCPACTERLEILRQLDASPQDVHTFAGHDVSSPCEGEIRNLSPALEGWDELCQYIRAPQVLILEIRHGYAQVALVSSATAFMQSTDLPLSEYIFLETWNTFLLPLRFLEGSVSTIPNELLDKARKASHGPHRVNGEDVWSREFRRAEKEIAETIALRASCLVAEPSRKWDWKKSLATILGQLANIFRDHLPAKEVILHAAYVGDRVELMLYTGNGTIRKSYADITSSNPSAGYIEMQLHLPKEYQLTRILALLEDDNNFVYGDVAIDRMQCYVSFEGHILTNKSVVTLMAFSGC